MLLSRQCRSLSTPACSGSRRGRSAVITRAVLVPCFSGSHAQTNGVRSLSNASLKPGSRMSCRSAADAGVSAAAAATPTTLYVSELDASVKGDDLTSHFKAQPGFESAFVMNVDGEDGQQRHMGYVQFSSAEAAAAARKALDGSELRQKRISVRSQQQDSSISTEEAQEEPSSDAAEPSGPATPQHTAATPATSEGTSSSSEQEGGPQDADGTEDSSSSGTSRSAKHRQRQNAKKQPPPPASPNVLFVPNMKEGTTEEQLAEHFREQPGYETVQLRYLFGRRSDGYVTFASAEAAAAALEALQGTKLNSKPLKIVIHEALTKERRAELAAANSAKSRQQQQPRQKADGGAAADGGDGSADSSSSSSRKAGRKQQQKPRLTYSVKVTNMSWSTDAEGLSKHFADCPGFVNAVTTLDEQGRANGIGYVKFNSTDAAQAAIEAKHKTELDERTINVFISAREAGKFAAAGADAGGSSGSRKGGRGAWALQVFNLAWETTEADLVEHFKDCPGYTGAFIVTSQDNRPSGQGYVTFNSKESQNEAFKVKQNTELVGRSIFLRVTRAGRVESGEGSGSAETGSDAGAADMDSTGTDAAMLDKTDLVLMGLPPSFTYKEVLGLCSYFGEVKGVVRLRKDVKQASSEEGGGSGGSAGEEGSKGSGAAATRDAAESARRGQPCFVMMATAKAAAAAVSALNQRTVQGVTVTAAFANPKPVKKSKRRQKASAAAAPADEQQGEGGSTSAAVAG